jgi:glycosyltransferase involved in cell wall biosynthesis
VKILFLALDVDLDGKYGDTVHVRELARAFRDKGCQTSLFVGKGGNTKGLEGIRVIVIKKYFSWKLRFIDDFRAMLAGICAIGLTGLSVRMITRSLLTVEINGLVDDEAKSVGNRNASRKSSGWSLHRANRIIAVAPGLAEALIERYKIDRHKVSVVSNGVDPLKFFPVSKEEAQNRLGLSTALKYLCFVGNMVAWYDFRTMLKALKLVVVKHPETRLIIAGEGKERPAIEALISDLRLSGYVMMPGYVNHDKVRDFICASDICLAPFTRSRNEKIGLSPVKLFEYLVCGIPVISSLIGGLDRYAVEIPALYLVKPEDAPALADKIVELFAKPDFDKNLEASEVVRSKYGWSNTAGEILNTTVQVK